MEATYTLTCEGCEEPFYSNEAFPKPQYCSKCSAVFSEGRKEVVEWGNEPCPHWLSVKHNRRMKRDCHYCWEEQLKKLGL